MKLFIEQKYETVIYFLNLLGMAGDQLMLQFLRENEYITEYCLNIGIIRNFKVYTNVVN